MTTPEACALVLEKVHAAVGALGELMLSDAWGGVLLARQRVVANALESMRSDAERLETIMVPGRSEAHHPRQPAMDGRARLVVAFSK